LREASEMNVPQHEDKGTVVPFLTEPLQRLPRIKASVVPEPALNVLVIDDMPEDRMAVRLALEARGFVLQEAADAKHGLKLAESSTPDCILLDYVLPGTEGLEVLESLRQPGGMPCAVVMLMEAETADVATAAIKAGALDYLIKDRLDSDTLGRAIRGAVRQFRLIEAQRVSERRNAQLAAIVTASSDAIISVGSDFAVQTWNAGAQRLFGYGEAEARGRRLTELIVPDIYEAESAAIYAAVVSGRAALLKESVRRHKDGQLVPVETNISPILDGAGRVTGLSVVLRDISERRRAADALRRHAQQQALLLKVTSDLIRASEPGELGRVTFEHVSSALGAVVCTNYRLDPARQRLRLEFVHGIPPEYLEAAQSLELGQEYCGTAAATCQPLVADKRRIASDPNGGLVRALGATAYACYPLKASDGRLLGTFAVASATREGFTDDEVAWLGTITNFLAQAWERFEAEQDLRASEERFRSSVLHSPLPILLFDDREQILALSRSWSDETGYSREDLRRIEDWTTQACGERSGEVLECIRQIISTSHEAQPTELIIRTKDGRERLWSIVVSALGTQSDGRRLFVCVAQDVTERKAHEDQVHLLMREVNHRAKNMLSLVQVIARQTAAREPETFVERFSERIQALAANQDLLVRNEWQGVDVEDLVRAQLAHFADLVGSRISVYGPKLRMNAAAAQAIGLALHELATNAGKYGALSVGAGRVDVRWRLDGGIFAMSWTERNGPPVSRPARRGFGSTVIGVMAKLTVGGEVQLDYAPSGLAWRLTCPAANALEPWEREQNFKGRGKSN
jgi:PAS domain S-box-containing protein